jgi:peptide chain release factor 2
LSNTFDIPSKLPRLKEINNFILNHKDWQQVERIKPLLQEKNQLQEIIKVWRNYKKAITDLNILYELAIEEQDSETLEEIRAEIGKWEGKAKRLELEWLLDQPVDKLKAVVEIHAGAGGTDAQDWVEMLLRMYNRWGEKMGFRVKLLDTSQGEEAGIKSVIFLVEGNYTYGFLKGETGVHRLIRISPFDTSGRRHTSFAAVSVYPQVDERIHFEIKQGDLKIETFRSGGAGGQHVNKVETGVRVTHIPSGIIVQCQDERSQFRNKEAALMVLKSRLYDLECKKKEQKRKEIYAQQKEIAWGNQIRTYTLHPYKLVKDHRTNLESPKIEAVLDGDITDFIKSYLLYSKKLNNGKRG